MSLKHGQVLDNQQLCDHFKCSPQGGMRRSLKTNTLVLISNHVESIYEDRWIGDVFHYTGMGQTGDQSLNRSQNKTLAESATNGVEVHLLEVERDKEYIYQGRVELAGDPYTELQRDLSKTERSVYVFPLRLIDGAQAPIAAEQYAAIERTRSRKAASLTLEQLRELAELAHEKPGERLVLTRQHERNPYVSEYTKRAAGGSCDLCGEEAPFKDKRGKPYLESHHIMWLADGGADTIKNTVALCPNCHRRMHVLDDKHDKQRLIERMKARQS